MNTVVRVKDFFICMRGFRKKRMLQIDIIENIRDERFIIDYVKTIFYWYFNAKVLLLL
ncbi:hypothetical protein [Clostridium tepidiprofundi]|uniref:hypothetical protein n=1 Tax=Clostridium tepidiprofundi TaxID=420412 RepID=UPI000AAAE8D6|nr:hypothetical protein [Clostridium tepidiprofundi]